MSNKSARWAFNFTKWDPSRADILLATSCIQPEEKVALSKFVFKKDVKSSLIGRLLMRKFVSESCELEYNEIKILRDDRGKPFLGNSGDFSKINFNSSHQGDFTVLAGCANGCQLGVDVVKTEFPKSKSLTEYFRIMTRVFSPQEWEKIRSQGGERGQLAMFCRLWSLKESYVKATGVGLTDNLQEVVFRINTDCLGEKKIVDDTEIFVKGDKLGDWQFQEQMLDEDHCVAVALNAKSEHLFFRELDFGQIVENAQPLLDEDVAYCESFFHKCDK